MGCGIFDDTIAATPLGLNGVFSDYPGLLRNTWAVCRNPFGIQITDPSSFCLHPSLCVLRARFFCVSKAATTDCTEIKDLYLLMFFLQEVTEETEKFC
jgi:hypothetical protein